MNNGTLDFEWHDLTVFRHFFDALADGLEVLLAFGDELTPLLERLDHLVEIHLAGLHLADEPFELLEVVFELHVRIIPKSVRLPEFDAPGFLALQMRENDVLRLRGDERTRPLRPLHDQDRALGEVVLPADGDHVVLAVKAIQIHVDEKALYRALKAKRLAGAYLDVRKHEPSATVLETSGYVPELADLPNCISMPHSSAFSPQYVRLCLEELKDDGCL